MGILDGILELASEETYRQSYRAHDPSPGDEREVLVFGLADEEYAVDILRVREILWVSPITWVPRTPSFALGVISVRGEIIPVLDLRERLGMPTRVYDKHARILTVVGREERFGLLVDDVRQVVHLRAEDIETAPGTLGGMEDYVASIGRPTPDRLLILLNLDAVLSFSVKEVK